MKITVSPTEEFFRTEEGFLVRLWQGSSDAGVPIFAYIAAISTNAKDSALVPIPGPNARITEVTWDKSR